MAKSKWHIQIAGQKVKNLRRYNWVTKLYKFILREPKMFKEHDLVIYEASKPVALINYDIVLKRHALDIRERKERSFIRDLGHYQKKQGIITF